eukprot:5740420-Amphidinium_carterae.1
MASEPGNRPDDTTLIYEGHIRVKSRAIGESRPKNQQTKQPQRQSRKDAAFSTTLAIAPPALPASGAGR